MTEPKLRAITAEPQGDNIIEKLDEALEFARKGELSSIGLVVVYRDGTTGASWSNAPSIGLLIAASARLQHRLLTLLDE